MVQVGGAGAGNPLWLAHHAGSSAFRDPPPQHSDKGFLLGAAAPIGFLVPLLLPPGGCGATVFCDP